MLPWTYWREKESGIAFLAYKFFLCFCKILLTEAHGCSSSLLIRKSTLIPISMLATGFLRHMINTWLRPCHIYQFPLFWLPHHTWMLHCSCLALTDWLCPGPWLSTVTNICQNNSTLRTPPKKMVMLPPPTFLSPYKQGQSVLFFIFCMNQ